MVVKGVTNWEYNDIKKYIESYNYELISKEYIKNKKIQVKCDKGHIYDVSWYKFYIGQRCKVCFNNSLKLKYDDVKKYIEDSGYKLLSSEYLGSSTKLELECDKGHIYTATFNKFKGGRRCPSCAKENRSKTQRRSFDDIKLYIDSLGYELLSNDDEYKNQNSKLRIKCDKGHEFIKSYSKLSSGQICTICSKQNKNKNLSFDFNFVKEQIEKDNYILLSTEYKNMKTKLKIKCDNNHEYEATFEKFMSGQRCPKCLMTDGEFKINQFLLKNNIKFNYQHKFKDCKIKRSLPFDFVIFNKDDIPILAIEYDGIHHYKAIYGEDKDLVNRRKYDDFKTQYCKNNNIEILRIPYFEFKNIEEILYNKITAITN